MSKNEPVPCANKVYTDNALAIAQAIHNIEHGVCQRVDVNDRIKVYHCKNVIRIDIKEQYG